MPPKFSNVHAAIEETAMNAPIGLEL